MPFLHTAVVPVIVAVGKGFTVTVAVPLTVFVQAVPLDSLTPVSAYTKLPEVFVGAFTVTLLPLVVVTVWLAPPFIVYVNVYGAVASAPVNVINGCVPFLHAAVVPVIVAVGKGLIMTWTAEALLDWPSKVLLL